MDADNVAVVQRVLERINAQDLDAAFADIDADATLDWSVSEAPDSGVYEGREAWREWISERRDALSTLGFDATELIDVAPDRVVMVARFFGRGRSSGLEIDATGAVIWQLADGRVSKITLYQSRAEALRAAGIAP